MHILDPLQQDRLLPNHNELLILRIDLQVMVAI
jgi:hypothetical protein